MQGFVSGANVRTISIGRALVKNIRLFCFPYAGAGASIYRQWIHSQPTGVIVHPIQLPGREDKINESALTSVPEIVDWTMKNLSTYFNGPFAFFGHSMGGLVSFELSRRLEQMNVRPIHLFISATRAPHIKRGVRLLNVLEDEELLAELCKLNGISYEVLRSQELVRLLIPTLRADLSVFESYVYQAGPLLTCPITIFGGIDDSRVNHLDLNAWASYTRANFRASLYPGDHFFIREHGIQMLELMGKVLRENVSAP